MRLKLLFATLGSVLLAAAAPPPAELEDFLSYPFVSELKASPQGGALAWIETRKGVRNIWVARAPDFAPQRLTANADDDGIELAALSWSPDGRVLAFVRGGGEGNEWSEGMDPPNPGNRPETPRMEVWASVDGASPVVLGQGEQPAVSSSGRIAFLHHGEVWLADPRGGAKAERLFYDRGKDSDIAWSPDGTRLAFVSHRLGHAFIGVWAGADRPLTWLAPSTGIDDDPAWSRDGTRIAFSRRRGTADILANPLDEQPNPFAIWVADPASGEGRQLWQSPHTLEGSYPQVPDGMFLQWGTGDAITFRAEMDGWPHLYALSAKGDEPRLLTPGAYMVEHVRLSPDGQALVYDANTGAYADDIDRRHVYSVDIAKDAPRALSSGNGIEFTPAPLAPAQAAWIGAGPTSAMRVMIGRDATHARVLDTGAPAYAPKGMVVPRAVTFTASDGTLVHGQLFAAPANSRPRPGLVFVHGGPPRQMLLGWSYMDYYAHAYAMNQYYAAHGYVVLSVNYRLGIGYGRAFQHPKGGGAAGNTEYRDVLAGAKFLAAQPGVDAARIGIWGGSYGGLLTAHALARDSALFKAGVDFHGVHDWTLYPERINRPQRYEQGNYEEAMRVAFESSPVSALKGWTSPVLLISGDDDRNVRFDQTIDLARRLAAQGTPFEELVLPDEIHGFLRYASWARADAASVEFLDRNLRK